MATLDFSYLRNIPQRQTALIHGYIREVQSEFEKDTTYYNIPLSINHICTLFYYIRDEWNKDRITKKYLIFEDKFRMKKLKSGFGELNEDSTVFLTEIAKLGQHHWKFEINKWQPCGYGIIGIVKDDINFEKVMNHWLGYYPNTTYCFDVNMIELNVHNVTNKWIGGYGINAKEGDIIDMYLDLDELELSFSINNKHYGKAFNVDTGYGYIGAVSFRDEEIEITLLSHDSKSYAYTK